MAVAVQNAIVKDMPTIAKCVRHLPLVCLSKQWGPTTLAFYHARCHRPWGTPLYDGNVGLVSSSQKSTLAYREQTRRIVCHEPREPLQGEHTLVYQGEHGNQRELYRGHARGRLGASSLLVRQRMRRMVGADGADLPSGKGLAQSRPVLRSFYGWIALDERAFRFIVAFREPQVGDDSLAGDRRQLVSGRWLVKQLKLSCRGHMRHMQMRAVTTSQRHSQRRARIA